MKTNRQLALSLVVHALKVSDLGMHMTANYMLEAADRLEPDYVPFDMTDAEAMAWVKAEYLAEWGMTPSSRSEGEDADGF